MPTESWYEQLNKPKWAPPPRIFSPVWSFLYILIIISFGTVLIRVMNTKYMPMLALPFALNLIFNMTFTYLQFKLRNNLLASIDILLILGTLVWAIIAIYPFTPWIAYMQIPYLLWVSFATVLQLTITVLNW